jgi:hypothetical protein
MSVDIAGVGTRVRIHVRAAKKQTIHVKHLYMKYGHVCLRHIEQERSASGLTVLVYFLRVGKYARSPLRCFARVWSTAWYAIHLQLDINAFEIKAVQCAKCISLICF